MFFDTWEELLRVLVVGTMAYAALVVLLRVTGKRTLSKMNAFDFVVTVALGSTLATVLLSRDVSLSEGVLAFAVLIFLQLAVTRLAYASRPFRKLVKAEPRLLMFRGEMLEDAMRQERVVPEEIMATIRASGRAGYADVEAVVLETDGSFTVIGKTEDAARPAMETVSNYPAG